MTPSIKEVRNFSDRCKTERRVIYLSVLHKALTRWSEISGESQSLGYLRNRDFARLFHFADSLSEQKYSDAVKHHAASQVAALIKKFPWDPAEIKQDPEGRAIKAFDAAEHRCRRMNQWFWAERRVNRNSAFLDSMRKWIRYVIKDVPDLRAIYKECDYTSGASIGVHGEATNLMRKLMVQSPTVTPTALPYYAAALNNHFHYSERYARRSCGGVRSIHILEQDVARAATLVCANKIEFVPKTAKTYRSIAVEPLGNGFIQKGIDLCFRQLLKRVGLDLSDQNPNQEMARQGSLPESEDPFCTIDLSSASDSISIELVREVLPPDWFVLLNAVRSPSYEYKGTVKRYHKFVSMGNGFCFPLQTLLFAAVCHTVKPDAKPGVDFRVYGDDIIVRRSMFDAVIARLRKIGFKPNVSKTFSEGPFRESCGADWYAGEDVRPFTLDFELDSLSSLFKFINLARRNALSSAFLGDCISYVISLIPPRLQFFRPFKGPADTGIDPLDVEFISPLWLRAAKRSKDARKWQLQYAWYELESRPVEDRGMIPQPWVVMAAALRGHTPERMFTLRRKTKTRVRLVARSGPTI